MKLLKKIPFGDMAALRAISANKRMGSFPELATNLGRIASSYKRYLKKNANPWMIRPLDLSHALAQSMHNHYEGKVQPLGVILPAMRTTGSSTVCPVCGSAKSEQLDHVLPYNTYPEFSFFTANLVPACNCNQGKGKKYKGSRYGVRTLHPYFDKILKQRLVYASITGDFDGPLIEIAITRQHRYNSTVKFHVEAILKNTSVAIWIGAMWGTLRNRPSTLLNIVPAYGPVTCEAIRCSVEQALKNQDLIHDTPNNWYSMMYAGILESANAVEYLTDRVNGLRANRIKPS